MRIRHLLVLAVALAALASPAAAAEQKRHTVGDGVSVSVPNTWVTINARQLVTKALLDRLARENPKLAPFVQQFARSGAPVKFVALDPAVRGGFASNLNVVSIAVPGNLTMEQYREALVGQVRAVAGGSRVADSVVQIDGEPAVRLSYRLRLTAAAKTFTVQTLQYAFLHRGKSLVFTYTTLPRFAGAYTQTFKASATSIRFGG